jgi:hypothetical protein
MSRAQGPKQDAMRPLKSQEGRGSAEKRTKLSGLTMSALSPSNCARRTFWKGPRNGNVLGSISARTWGDTDCFNRLHSSFLLVFRQTANAGHHDVGNFVCSFSLARALGLRSHNCIFARAATGFKPPLSFEIWQRHSRQPVPLASYYAPYPMGHTSTLVPLPH